LDLPAKIISQRGSNLDVMQLSHISKFIGSKDDLLAFSWFLVLLHE
jgi:hypothetical protein